MNDVNKNINIKAEWIKSREALKEAQVLLVQELEGGTISRSYYAVFHAAKALLLSKGLDVSTHQGVARLFNLHFIQPGLIDKKFSRILSRAKQEREEADYFAEYSFSLTEAQEHVSRSIEFLTVAENYLAMLGYSLDD